jgi:hypothetical protein
LPDTDDKYDLGFLILEDLTTQLLAKTAELLLSLTRTCDQAKETNLSKKSLKKSQSPFPNPTNSMPSSSVTNHNGLFAHRNNLPMEMFWPPVTWTVSEHEPGNTAVPKNAKAKTNTTVCTPDQLPDLNAKLGYSLLMSESNKKLADLKPKLLLSTPVTSTLATQFANKEWFAETKFYKKSKFLVPKTNAVHWLHNNVTSQHHVLAAKNSKPKLVPSNACQINRSTLFAHQIMSKLTLTKNGVKPPNLSPPETPDSVSVNSTKHIWISNTPGLEKPVKTVPFAQLNKSKKKPEITSTNKTLVYPKKFAKWTCAIGLVTCPTKDPKCTPVSDKTPAETQATI